MHAFIITMNQNTDVQFFISNEQHALDVKKTIMAAIKSYAKEDLEQLLHIESDEGDFMIYASQVVTFQCYRPADAQRAHDDAVEESELASMNPVGGVN